MSEEKLNKAAAKGARASRLLADPLLAEVFDKLKAEYIEAWEQSNPRDDDGRQRLWQCVQLLGRIKNHIKQVESNGKLAQAELKRLAKG
jgi:hypothetical protein